LAKAKTLLFRQVSQFFPEPDRNLTDGDEVLSATSQFRHVHLFSYISEYLGRLRESVITFAFGIQVKDYLFLTATLSYAAQFMPGNWSINKRRSMVSKEEAHKALGILINIGIKISSVLG
jgi:hypothetical protein